MKTVLQGYEIINESNPLKKIERAARTCYKSEDKITDESAEKMVRALVRRKHYAMLEHASIILDALTDEVPRLTTYFQRSCGRIVELRITDFAFSGRTLISGNMRAWLEFFNLCMTYNERVSENLVKIFLQEKYKPIFDSIEFEKITTDSCIGHYFELSREDLDTHEMMVHYDMTVKFICDRGVSHEIVRHRKASFAQESTRYCAYKDGITTIKPLYIEKHEQEKDYPRLNTYWDNACVESEYWYKKILSENISPQDARAVLPTCVKTEVVMTANLMEWRHFFKLRALGTTGKPHPQIENLAQALLAELKENGGKVAMVLGDLTPNR